MPPFKVTLPNLNSDKLDLFKQSVQENLPQDEDSEEARRRKARIDALKKLKEGANPQ